MRRKCLKCLRGNLLVFVPVGWLKFPFCWLSILFFPLLAVPFSENQLVKEICLLGHAAIFSLIIVLYQPKLSILLMVHLLPLEILSA